MPVKCALDIQTGWRASQQQVDLFFAPHAGSMRRRSRAPSWASRRPAKRSPQVPVRRGCQLCLDLSVDRTKSGRIRTLRPEGPKLKAKRTCVRHGWGGKS